MAGSPNRLAKRVGQLRARARQMAKEIGGIAERFVVGDRDDPLAAGWESATAAIKDTEAALAGIGEQLRTRTGKEADDDDALLAEVGPALELVDGDSDGWEALLEATAGKTATTRTEQDWVKNNLHKTPADMDAESVPSTGALHLLREAKADKRWFFEKIIPKSKPQGPEDAEPFHDDERELLELIAMVQKGDPPTWEAKE